LTRDIGANVILSEELVNDSNFDPEEFSLLRQDQISLAGHERKIVIFHDEFEN